MTVLVGALIFAPLLAVFVAVSRWAHHMERLVRALGRQVGVVGLEEALEKGQRELPWRSKAIEFAICPLLGALWLSSNKNARRKILAGGVVTAAGAAFAFGHLSITEERRVVEAAREWARLNRHVFWA